VHPETNILASSYNRVRRASRVRVSVRVIIDRHASPQNDELLRSTSGVLGTASILHVSR